MDEIRKTLKQTKCLLKILQRLLDENNVPTAIDFDEIEKDFMFLFGFLECKARSQDLVQEC